MLTNGQKFVAQPCFLGINNCERISKYGCWLYFINCNDFFNILSISLRLFIQQGVSRCVRSTIIPRFLVCVISKNHLYSPLSVKCISASLVSHNNTKIVHFCNLIYTKLTWRKYVGLVLRCRYWVPYYVNELKICCLSKLKNVQKNITFDLKKKTPFLLITFFC